SPHRCSGARAWSAPLYMALPSLLLQAEAAIRDRNVTGVQPCALPLSKRVSVFLLFDCCTGRISVVLARESTLGCMRENGGIWVRSEARRGGGGRRARGGSGG